MPVEDLVADLTAGNAAQTTKRIIAYDFQSCDEILKYVRYLVSLSSLSRALATSLATIAASLAEPRIATKIAKPVIYVTTQTRSSSTTPCYIWRCKEPCTGSLCQPNLEWPTSKKALEAGLKALNFKRLLVHECLEAFQSRIRGDYGFQRVNIAHFLAALFQKHVVSKDNMCRVLIEFLHPALVHENMVALLTMGHRRLGKESLLNDAPIPVLREMTASYCNLEHLHYTKRIAQAPSPRIIYLPIKIPTTGERPFDEDEELWELCTVLGRVLPQLATYDFDVKSNGIVSAFRRILSRLGRTGRAFSWTPPNIDTITDVDSDDDDSDCDNKRQIPQNGNNEKKDWFMGSSSLSPPPPFQASPGVPVPIDLVGLVRSHWQAGTQLRPFDNPPVQKSLPQPPSSSSSSTKTPMPSPSAKKSILSPSSSPPSLECPFNPHKKNEKNPWIQSRLVPRRIQNIARDAASSVPSVVCYL